MRAIIISIFLFTYLGSHGQNQYGRLNLFDFPILFTDGSVHHRLLGNKKQKSSFKKEKIRLITSREKAPPQCDASIAKNWISNTRLDFINKDGSVKYLGPTDAIYRYTKDSLVKTCIYSESKEHPQKPHGYTYSYHFYHIEYFYKRKQLVKTIIREESYKDNGLKEISYETLSISKKCIKNVNLERTLRVKDKDTLEDYTICAVYNRRKKPIGIYKLKAPLKKDQYTKLKENTSNIFKELLAYEFNIWDDSANLAYNDSLNSLLGDKKYREYEDRKDSISDYYLDEYENIATEFTGFEYDNKGNLIKKGVFFKDKIIRFDKLKYNKYSEVANWIIYDFKGQPQKSSNIINGFKGTKSSWTFIYNEDKRVKTCHWQVWEIKPEDSNYSYFDYTQKSIYVFYRLFYTYDNKIDRVRIYDDRAGKCYKTYTYNLDYFYY